MFFYFRNLEIQVEALASISGDLYVHVEAFASLPLPSYAPGNQMLWCFFVISMNTVELKFELPFIHNAFTLIWHHYMIIL